MICIFMEKYRLGDDSFDEVLDSRVTHEDGLALDVHHALLYPNHSSSSVPHFLKRAVSTQVMCRRRRLACHIFSLRKQPWSIDQ